MSVIRHPEFRDEYAATNYPFSDTATLTAGSGNFFTSGTFVDGTLYPLGNLGNLYVSEIVITSNSCQFYLGDSANTQLASGTLTFSTLLSATDTEDIAISFTDTYGRPAGMLLSDKIRLAIFQTWPHGSHTFEETATELAASVCIPMPDNGVTGILLEDGSFFSGDVWIVGEGGVVLNETVEIATVKGATVTYPTIRADVVGDPLFVRRLCSSPTAFQTPSFITQLTVVNGCRQISLSPDNKGDIAITVGNNDTENSILRIRNTGENLTIEAVGEILT